MQSFKARRPWVQWVISTLVVLLLGASLLICHTARAFNPIIREELPDLSRLPWYMYISIVVAPHFWIGSLVLATGMLYVFLRQDRAESILPVLLGLTVALVVLSVSMIYFTVDALMKTRWKY